MIQNGNSDSFVHNSVSATGQHQGFVETDFQDEGGILSSETVARLTQLFVSIIDDRIKKRLEEQDIIKVYDAKIISMKMVSTERLTSNDSDNTTEINGELVRWQEETLTDGDYNHEEVTFLIPAVQSIVVEYNNGDRQTIENDSVKQLAINGKLRAGVGSWVKICTYDRLQYYVLHLL